MSLAAGQQHAAIANHRLEPVGQFAHEIHDVGSFGGLQNFSAAAVSELPVGEIVFDRVVEEHDVLADKADIVAQVAELVLLHRVSVQQYFA